MICVGCSTDQPEDNFELYKNKNGTGRRKRCRSCRRADLNKWQADNRDRVRQRMRTWRHKKPDLKEWTKDNNLRHVYGISLADYQQMVSDQGGKCAICRTDDFGGIGATLHVDHDHTTGKVRGLLCHGCNTSLGGFKDDPATLRRAAEYLEGKK